MLFPSKIASSLKLSLLLLLFFLSFPEGICFFAARFANP